MYGALLNLAMYLLLELLDCNDKISACLGFLVDRIIFWKQSLYKGFVSVTVTHTRDVNTRVWEKTAPLTQNLHNIIWRHHGLWKIRKSLTKIALFILQRHEIVHFQTAVKRKLLQKYLLMRSSNTGIYHIALVSDELYTANWCLKQAY